MPTILVVDDDPIGLHYLTIVLSKAGYTVTAVESPTQALAAVVAQEFELLILDVMLPGMDGLELCQRLRRCTSAPIIFVSARVAAADKVKGLWAGGDAYLGKPFAPDEMLAYVEALLRRWKPGTDDAGLLYSPDLILDPVNDNVTLVAQGKTVDLTPIETRLLRCLMQHRGAAVRAPPKSRSSANELERLLRRARKMP